ncbi:MAG TPA: 3-oxoacyl-[acyl-carrier-protein] synthase III C-terminal domain-containing protein [Pyrinomonadaceae bacterium]|nr:3-oxoacyl-[acyl-carrier-protein] synthase III C-terminal domain-containing protein [Pyrinomonadaceae bacterium]
MSLTSAGIRAVAISLPGIVRTNDYYRAKYPEIVDAAEQKILSRIFSPVEPSANTHLFDQEMEPYLKDPFRGTVERRLLAPGETSLLLETRAARAALAAAKMTPQDVELLIVSSVLPEQVGPGNAPFLSAELGLRGNAFNLESMCSSAVQAIHLASTLVRAGEYRNALVVVSCNYSRHADEDDTLSWFLADAAGAFVIGKVPQGEGILGAKSIHTAETCGAFRYDLVSEPNGQPRLRMLAGKNTSKQLRENNHTSILQCCKGAAKAAGVALGDIDFFVFNTPVPWYAKYAARALGIDPARTICRHSLYANVGPALPAVNLYHAASEGKIKKGDLVMLYSIGSVSSASAVVMRWGDVALGDAPACAAEVVRQ